MSDTFREIMRDVINEKGKKIICAPAFVAMMADIAPTYEKERKLLKIADNEGITNILYKDIVEKGNPNWKSSSIHCIQKLEDATGMKQEVAAAIVADIAYALGVNVPTPTPTPVPKPRPIPRPRESIISKIVSSIKQKSSGGKTKPADSDIKKWMKRILIPVVVVALVAIFGTASYLAKRQMEVNEQKRVEAQRLELSTYEEALKNDSFISAGNLLQNIEFEENVSAITNASISYAAKQYDEYCNNNISFSDAKERIEAMKKGILEDNATLSELETKLSTMKSSHESFEQGVDAYNQSNFIKSINFFNEVLDSDKHYSEAQNYIKKAKESYAEIVVAKADELIEQGEYQEAHGMLKAAAAYVDNAAVKERAESVSTILEEKEVAEILEDVTTHVKSDASIDGYDYATKKLDALRTKYPSNEQVKEQLDEYMGLKYNMLMGEVKDLINQRRFIAVNQKLQYMKVTFPDNTVEIEELLTKYKNVKTTSLYLLDLYHNSSANKSHPDVGPDHSDVDVTDTYGNERRRCMTADYLPSSKYYIRRDYLVTGEYNAFTAKAGYYLEGEKYIKGAGRVLVYADDEQIYCSPIITESTEPFDINVDIGNCRVFSVELRGVDGEEWAYVFISDPKLLYIPE